MDVSRLLVRYYNDAINCYYLSTVTLLISPNLFKILFKKVRILKEKIN